ncbi:C_GCAxxG_C_C family protein [Candidatus Bathyarchaeota archaeon]|nr:C_GCAxxG_C_C family protein [Candidatus Bathyarchaeota archaeon]
MEEEIINKAVSKFLQGYNCAEAVLSTLADFLGIKCKQIPRIATGLGGGIGHSGSVCGALTGAVMALGLKYGRDRPEQFEAYQTCMNKSLEFYKSFEKIFGSIYCRDLTGCNLSTPEGLEKFRMHQIKEKKCVKYVEYSVRALLKLIKE